jgi:hypothetical protein
MPDKPADARDGGFAPRDVAATIQKHFAGCLKVKIEEKANAKIMLHASGHSYSGSSPVGGMQRHGKCKPDDYAGDHVNGHDHQPTDIL